MKLDLESMSLQMQADKAAKAKDYARAAELTEKAAARHEGKSQQDLQERAAYYRGLLPKS